MAHNDAIVVLFAERSKLITERDAMLSRYNEQINGIEASIEVLSGKKAWEVEPETAYDDQNHDYIRSSQEEM